jgi:hypothetical protein
LVFEERGSKGRTYDVRAVLDSRSLDRVVAVFFQIGGVCANLLIDVSFDSLGFVIGGGAGWRDFRCSFRTIVVSQGQWVVFSRALPFTSIDCKVVVLLDIFQDSAAIGADMKLSTVLHK